MSIKALEIYDEIAQSFDVFWQLRHHLTDKEFFVAQVMGQKGYEIIAIEEREGVPACIGFRFLTTLAWRKILSIGDLIAKKSVAKHMEKFY